MSQPPSDFLERPRRRHPANQGPHGGAAYLQGPEAGQGVEEEEHQEFYGARMRNRAAPRGARSTLLFGAVVAGVVLNVMLAWRLTKSDSTENLPLQPLEELVIEHTLLNEREKHHSSEPSVKPAWPWELGELVRKEGLGAVPRKVVAEDPWDSSDESSQDTDSD
ncbi:hypothetical protein Emed_000969 [Eimeria media]